MPEPEFIKRDAIGENGKLSCHRCMFDQIKANLVEIQPEKRQNVQKTGFLQKAPGFNGLIKLTTMIPCRFVSQRKLAIIGKWQDHYLRC